MPGEELLDRVVSALERWEVKRRGSKWTARCPVHGGDDNDSLEVTRGDQQEVLIKCHSRGCSYGDVMSALGIDLDRERRSQRVTQKEKLAEVSRTRYVYEDASGAPVYSQLRIQYEAGKKTFRMFMWTDEGWAPGGPTNVQRVPYHLPELIAAVEAGKPIWIVEGEKDCDRLISEGLAATTFGGASGWQSCYRQWFAGAHVIICPDRDEPGQKLAKDIKEGLDGVAGIVDVVNLPYDLSQKSGKDVSDFLDDEWCVEDLAALHRGSWIPPGYITADGAMAASLARRSRTTYESFGMLGLGPEHDIPGIGLGVFALIGARLGVGKTAWLVELCVRALEAGKKVLFASYDEPPDRIVEYLAACRMRDFRYQTMTKDMFWTIENHAAAIEDWADSLLIDGSYNRTAKQLCEFADRWKPDLLLVDHLTRIRTGEAKDQLFERAATASEVFRQASRSICPIVCATQINREGEHIGDRLRHEHVYGGDQAAQHADIILMIQRVLDQELKSVRVTDEISIQKCQDIQDLIEDRANWEGYRVIHAAKNRLGREFGFSRSLMCGAEKRMFPLHRSSCQCDWCAQHRATVAARGVALTACLGYEKT